MAADDPIISGRRVRRGFFDPLRRRPLLFIAALSLVASAVLLCAPFLTRAYAVAATVRVTTHTAAQLPEVQDAPRAAAAGLRSFAAGAGVSIDIVARREDDVGGIALQTARFSAAGPSHDAAAVAVLTVANRFAVDAADAGRAAVLNYQAAHRKRLADLTTQEQQTNRDLDAFRIAHPGALPDDPDSIPKRFDKLQSQLDERSERLRQLTDQIARLEDFKKGGHDLPAATTAPSGAPIPAPAPAAVDEDPEVVTLAAQLQLVNAQIDEQLNKFSRTELHPYVIGLRSQQTDLQKKLDAAKARAATGQPAPANLILPPVTGGAAPSARAVQAQAVDLQLAQLRAEKEEVDTYLKQLTAQRDALQDAMHTLGPVRRDYDALQSKITDIHKQRDAAAAELDAAHRAYPGLDAPDAATLPNAIAPVDPGPVLLEESSSLPIWPTVPHVFAAAAAAGIIAALLVTFLAAAADRSLRTADEAAAHIGIPILAAIPIIRTAAAQRAAALWRTLLRPACIVLFIALLGASGYLSWRHLRNPGFDTSSRNPAALLSLAPEVRP